MHRVQAIANRYSRATTIASKNKEIATGETTRLFVRQRVADAITLATLLQEVRLSLCAVERRNGNR